MVKAKKLCFKYPLTFSIIALLIFSYLTEIRLDKFFFRYMDNQSAAYLNGIIEQGFSSLIILLIIIELGLSKDAGFTNPKSWKQTYLVWPVLALSILNGWSFFSGAIIIDTSNLRLIIFFILLFITTGLFEEFLCRGLIMTIMLKKWGNTKKGIYLSVIASSILFSLFHIINFLMGRSTIVSVFTQMGYALFFGVFFCSCMLRNNSIWPVVISHTIFDICGNFNEIMIDNNFGNIQETTSSDAIVSIIITLPLLIYGLFILRKVKPNSNS